MREPILKLSHPKREFLAEGQLNLLVQLPYGKQTSFLWPVSGHPRHVFMHFVGDVMKTAPQHVLKGCPRLPITGEAVMEKMCVR